MRDIFSSEYWLLGKSCLEEIDWGRISVFAHSELSTSKFNAWALNGSCQKSSWFILSWQDMQCGLYSLALFGGVLGKSDLEKKRYDTKIPYWHMTRPQCIMWPNCAEAPGCHLTICGGFRCIGKGLVNAYSVMVRPEFVFSPFVRKEGVDCSLLFMISNWSVHRFSLPTVVFPWSKYAIMFLTCFLYSLGSFPSLVLTVANFFL